MMPQPHPSSFNLYALGKSYFAGDFRRAIASFRGGIKMNPSFMPNHYDLAIDFGRARRFDSDKTSLDVGGSESRCETTLRATSPIGSKHKACSTHVENPYRPMTRGKIESCKLHRPLQSPPSSRVPGQSDAS